MKKPVLIYGSAYDVSFGAHVFPATKYSLSYRELSHRSLLSGFEVIEPRPALADELLLTHMPDYVRDFMNCEMTPDLITSELPLNPEIRDFFLNVAGGSITTVRECLQRDKGMHLSGGFHHAFPDHAEGFCYLNDVAIAVKTAKNQGLVDRVAVVDCDLHQGNGTAYIFRNDRSVLTLSIHQENLYPIKETSDIDIGLDDFTGDHVYLEKLSEAYGRALRDHRPELVCYVAGADPFIHDQLGNLQLSKGGLAQRDRLVFEQAVSEAIPVCAFLAGGYAVSVSDVVDIHVNTCQALLEA